MAILTSKSTFAQQLLDALKGRRTPLPIVLAEHRVIEAQHFGYEGTYSMSVTFYHPEGDIAIGSNWPSRAMMDGLSPDQLANMTYAELADSTCDSRGCEWQQLDECPWVTSTDSKVTECFDANGVFVRETPVLRSRLIRWLSEEDEEAPYIDALFPDLHEGLVGYAIRDGLPDAEAKRLGLITGDFWGGPGGYAERVAYIGPQEALEAALRKWMLPFTLGDEEERSTR